MTKHSMRHVFRADVKDQDGVWDGVWFETDEYTRDSAKALFKRRDDGDGFDYYGESYSDVAYLGVFRDDQMPQTDSDCVQALIDLDEADEYDEERLSVYDAALIWASHGKDEDYMYGYTEDELERAL